MQQKNTTISKTYPNLCVAFVGDRPFDVIRGGIGRVTNTITKALQTHGITVVYYSLTSIPVIGELSAPMHTAPAPDATSPEVIADYQRFLERNHVDTLIIQASQTPTITLFLNTGRLRLRKIVCIHNSPLWFYTHLWQARIASLKVTSLRSLKKLISRFLFLPRHKRRTLAQWKRYYQPIAESKAELVLLSERYFSDIALTGIDFQHRLHAIPNINTYPEPLSVDWGTKNKELLYVGRLEDFVKQVSLLLRIWKRVAPQAPEWTLTIVGSGPDEEDLKQLAARLNLPRLRFVGRQDPTPYYRRASILCLTSLFEGFPMVLTEAQQQGTAVIAFDSFAAVRDTIEDGINGVLVTPFKQREYAEKLLHLMQDEEYRLRLARRARETVQRFNADVILPQWLRYLGITENESTAQAPH